MNFHSIIIFASYWKNGIIRAKKYGWSFRIKDKKRSIIYDDIKNELQNARVYAKGRGIRIEITDEAKLADVKRLIEIKLAN